MRFPEALATTLEAGGLVVTSSARAAHALRRLHGEQQRRQGLAAWRAAEIVDWDGWLDRLWQRRLRAGAESRLLLSTLQEHQVWVRLIKPEIEGQRLISIDGVAELAQSAYALLCGYGALDFLNGARQGGSDVESFRAWARSFLSDCRREEWLSRSALPLVLSEAVLAGDVDLPAELTLTGFDRVIPAQQNLIAAFEQRGCAIQWIESGPTRAPAGPLVEALVEAMDAREEIAACAKWVRHVLRTAAAEHKSCRIAVIVPDVRRLRAELERIFRQVLAPQAVLIGPRELPLPFEFSLGVPLAEVPMARAALLLLGWMEEAIRQEEVIWLLFSGFLSQNEAELLSLAAMDAEMRKKDVLPPERELDAFLRQSRGYRSEALAGLHAARGVWRQSAGENHTFSEWAERAEQILEAAGWPGAHRLESEDFQAGAKWAQLLDSIATLSFDGRRASYGEFRKVLERQAQQTVFSPESRDAPVQVLGPLESAGMEFDAVWFLGADDASWPPPGRPHPFLTRALQKQRGMPHADSDADWQLAKLVTERIQSSAASCVFSYALQDKNGPCRPSTTVGGARLVLSTAQLLKQIGAAEAGSEEQPQGDRVAIETEPAAGIRWPEQQDAGGYSVLKMQAACPFQAFATVRLRAGEMRREDWGLEPRERGTVLHRVLEALWTELRDRETLIAAREAGRLKEIVERHVDNVLARYRGQQAEDPWSIAYLEAERERISTLVDEWLTCEEKRAPFAVEQTEQKLSAQVGELKLKLKADRIDAVSGGRLLIDYKSGKVNVAAWEGERPDEPQLPLYAAYGNVAALQGVLLAQVRAGEVKFEGRVNDADTTFLCGESKSTLMPYSEELRQHWREVLLALGEQFLNGEAQVDPKEYPKTCTFCPLPGLCRVAETNLRPADEEAGRDD